MEVCCIVFRCGATLNKVQVSAFLNNNKRVLKLASTLSIQSEVTLKWIVQSDIFRNIDKRTARPHGIVQRRKLVICWRNQLAKVLFNNGLPLWIM